MRTVTRSFLLVTAVLAGAAACRTTDASPQADTSAAALRERGRYMVTAMGCNDCHTPLVMTPTGPARDTAHLLSGHPESLVMPPAPVLPAGPWNAVVGATMTAWSGPWGTSFTANLTPDPETGLGTWTTRNFIDTIRNARHMGVGRPLLPPMPADMIAKLTDDDLAAIFAYLQSIPAVKNRVPQPLPPG